MRHPWFVVFVVTALVLVLALRFARASDDRPLAVGDPAPAFALTGSDGAVHRLADLAGRTVVLAWFPKAFTGG